MAVTVQGVGQVDGGANRVEMLLKQFGGLVIVEFQRMFKLGSLHRTKQLAPGRKADVFPAVGKAARKYHRAGDNFLTDAGFLQSLLQGDRSIWADRECIAPIVIDNLEEKLTYFPDRLAYAQQLAGTLAEGADLNTMRVLARSARGYTTAPYTGAPTGEYITPADAGGTINTEFTAAQLVEAHAVARERMQNKSIPAEDRYSIIAPSTMRLLMGSAAGREHINKDYNPPNGSIAEGVVYKLHGFTLIESNNFPSLADPGDDSEANYTAVDYKIGQASASGEGNDYRVDMRDNVGVSGSATRAMCFQRTALGTVSSSDIGLETERKIELRGDVVVASYAMGPRRTPSGVRGRDRLQHEACGSVSQNQLSLFSLAGGWPQCRSPAFFDWPDT